MVLPSDGSTLPGIETEHITLVPGLTFCGMHVPLYVFVPALPILVTVTPIAFAGRLIDTPRPLRNTTVYFIGILCAVLMLVKALCTHGSSGSMLHTGGR